MERYVKSYEIKWSDIDPNRHARHSSYGDYATHLRYTYLRDQGYPDERFAELGMGAVILREEMDFRKELRFGDVFQVDFQLAGSSPDMKRWRIRHQYYRPDGKQAATLEIHGGWIDLTLRKLVAPPRELAEVFFRLPRVRDFVTLDDRGRGPRAWAKASEPEAT